LSVLIIFIILDINNCLNKDFFCFTKCLLKIYLEDQCLSSSKLELFIFSNFLFEVCNLLKFENKEIVLLLYKKSFAWPFLLNLSLTYSDTEKGRYNQWNLLKYFHNTERACFICTNPILIFNIQNRQFGWILIYAN
jgi:hypothetical protein